MQGLPQINDLTNASFEVIGGICTWMNVLKLAKDRVIRGVDWRVSFFWWSWGAWNLVYYPSLNQMASFIGGLILCAGNAAWIFLALKFRNK